MPQTYIKEEMSLVSFNEANEWRVVLRDESRKALVLYDNSSKKMTLVNDPIAFNRFYDYYRRNNSTSIDADRVSNGFLQFLTDQSSSSSSSAFSEGIICSNCGQFIPARNGDSGVNNSSVVRDANYFKLLQSGEEEDDDDGSSAHIYSSISQSAFSQGYFERFFVPRRDLGRGSRGMVQLVEHVLDHVSLGLFALKKVPVGDDHIWLEKVLSEVHLLKLLSHPNLVSYNHVWLENSQLNMFGPSVPCAFILQEYCNGGTLEDYIRERQVQGMNNSKQSKRERMRRKSMGQEEDEGEVTCLEQLLSPQEVMSFITDIVSGIKHLHQNQIIHRDIKPSNCLLSSTENDTFDNPIPRVLVSDFGEGQMEGIKRTESGSTGTLEYCAPELISIVDGHFAQFSKKTDVFSLGMVLHYLCFSHLPYSKSPWEERVDIDALKEEVLHFPGFDIGTYRNGDRFVRNDLPPGLYTLLAKMVSVNPKDRPDTTDILVELSRMQGEDEESARIRILSTEPADNIDDLTPERASITAVSSPESMQLISRSTPGPPVVQKNRNGLPQPLPAVVQRPSPLAPERDDGSSKTEKNNPRSVTNSDTRAVKKRHVSLPTFALFKSLLFILKVVSYTRLEANYYPKDVLLLLIGVEIPLMTLTGSLAMFLLHWLVIGVTTVIKFLGY